MYVVFNAFESGLGNNGGSRTILKCAEALRDCGVRCDVVAPVDNFTWFSHKPTLPLIPREADVVVATSWATMASTIACGVPKKAWYIRGHETWSCGEAQLAKLYNYPGVKNIVNSKGLQDKLLSYGAKSSVLYQGVDLHDWTDLDLRPTNKIRIGCLHQKKPTKRWKDFVKLASELGHESYEYVALGSEKINEIFLTDYKYNIPQEEILELYSSCHIWFVPTELEGLHNPPMEAALCGALIVCTDHPMSGISKDYGLLDTAMIYKHRDIKQAAQLIRNPSWDKVAAMQNYITQVIGSRKANMQRLECLLEAL